MSNEEKNYIFFGRIHPERCAVDLKIPPFKFNTSNFNAEIDFIITKSQLIIKLKTSKDIEIYTLKNYVEEVIRSAVDSYGYLTGRGYDVEIISAINPNNEYDTFSIEIPALAKFRESNMMKIEDIFKGVLKSSNFSKVLFNIREAIRQPADTGFFCYRAIESIRQDFLPKEEDDKKKARTKSWKNLNEKLLIDRNFTKTLEEFATPLRHGESMDISDEKRAKLFLTTYKIIDRYIIYLRDGKIDESKFEKLE